MKKTILIVALALSTNAFSQPVIQNGNNIPAVGTTAALYAGTPVSGIGNPGANQTWDFSNVTFTASGMTWTVVAPASTPYFSSFPSANYAWSFTSVNPTRYFYFNVSATQFDVLADNLQTPGTGNDFTPDNLTVIRFPFSYGDTVQDTYQKVGGSPGNTIVTYDGYGTLITPFATYTNVWRVKEDRGGNITYTWENENPLQPILVYTQSNNSFTLFGNTPLTGINDQSNFQTSFSFYPNPAKDKITIKTREEIIKAEVYNLAGILQKAELNDKELNVASLSSGMYFMKIYSAKGIAIQKFLKN